jgi:hypothetical protein
VYTANYGSYDEIYPIKNRTGITNILFTDRDIIDCKGWTVVKYDDFPEDYTPLMKAKFIKMFPCKVLPEGTETTIWVDSSFEIISPTFYNMVLSHLKTCDVTMYKHPARRCIHEEMKQISRYAKHNKLNVKAQVMNYLSHNMPLKFGLWAGGLIGRNNTPISIKLSELWWSEILRWTPRDQLSLPFILWKNNIKINTINRNQYQKDLFIIHEHK